MQHFSLLSIIQRESLHCSVKVAYSTDGFNYPHLSRSLKTRSVRFSTGFISRYSGGSSPVKVSKNAIKSVCSASLRSRGSIGTAAISGKRSCVTPRVLERNHQSERRKFTCVEIRCRYSDVAERRCTEPTLIFWLGFHNASSICLDSAARESL